MVSAKLVCSTKFDGHLIEGSHQSTLSTMGFLAWRWGRRVGDEGDVSAYFRDINHVRGSITWNIVINKDKKSLDNHFSWIKFSCEAFLVAD